MKKVTTYLIDQNELSPLIIFLKGRAFDYIQCRMQDKDIMEIDELYGICDYIIREINTISTIEDLIFKVENEDFGQIGIADMEELFDEYNDR